MVARLWRGWTARDSADEVIADLWSIVRSRFEPAAGNVSATLLSRPIGGGIEVMTLSMWESEAVIPADVAEAHRLLVAAETIPAVWEVADTAATVARAA